jgi:hypothetical protein
LSFWIRCNLPWLISTNRVEKKILGKAEGAEGFVRKSRISCCWEAEAEGERWLTDMVAHAIDRREEEEKGVEKITASLGHIIRQKNVKSARDDDKRRGWGSGIRDMPRANTRESEKDRWIVETLDSGSGK